MRLTLIELGKKLHDEADKLKYEYTSDIDVYKHLVSIRHMHYYNYDQIDDLDSDITVTCPVDGHFRIDPIKHLQGEMCPKCVQRTCLERSDSQLVTTFEFVRKLIWVFDDKFGYTKVRYINQRTKVTIGCSVHGDVSVIPKYLFRWGGCPACIRKTSSYITSKEEFIEKARGKHGNKYDYSLSVYKRSKIPVIIICPIHGEFSQKPEDHYHSGCFECGKINTPQNRITGNAATFIDRANKIHNNKYDYSLSVYIKCNRPITIICPIHGEFRKSPSKHLSGQGCQRCSNYGYQDSLPGIFYCIRVCHPVTNEKLYKIGITNRSVKERYANESVEYGIIHQRRFRHGKRARQYELMLKRLNVDKLYPGASPFKNTGITELYTVDVTLR